MSSSSLTKRTLHDKRRVLKDHVVHIPRDDRELPAARLLAVACFVEVEVVVVVAVNGAGPA